MHLDQGHNGIKPVSYTHLDVYKRQGLGLPGNGTIPAVESQRILLAKHAGMKIMELVEKNLRPRDTVSYTHLPSNPR